MVRCFLAFSATWLSFTAGEEPAIKEGRRSHFHGYRSSEPWLPRHAVVGEALLAEDIVKPKDSLPTQFDWRDVGGRSFVTTDLNQHIPIYCGACWVHGTVHALNDRIKIMRKGRFPDVLLSRQAINNCVPDPSGKGPPPGCNGGDANMIHNYMKHNPVPDDSCMPYVGMNQECAPVNVCRNCKHNMTIMPDGHPFFTPGPCFGVEKWTRYGVSSYGTVSGEAAMMKEIYARGPIVCSSATDDVFVYNYTENAGVQKEGVYITDVPFTVAQIDHLMEVTGWGETSSGVKYWVVRNSWGTYWGDLGWVKIRRGVNQMQIESGCGWAIPEFSDVERLLDATRGAMGDYMLGIVNLDKNEHEAGRQKSVPAPLGQTLAALVQGSEVAMAAAPVGQHFLSRDTLFTAVCSMAAAASIGAIMGSFATRLMMSRKMPQQQNLLG